MKKEHRKLKIFIYTVVVVLLTLCAAYFGLHLAGYDIMNHESYEKAEELNKRYGKLYEIQSHVEKDFLWGDKSNFQMDNVYREYLKSLNDPYTRYLDKDELKELEQSMNSAFVGIGIVFGPDDKDNLKVLEVVLESPAEKAGLKTGDILEKINGKEYTDANKASKVIRGKAGTEVEITYSRDGKSKTVKIVRGEVKSSTVNYAMLKDNIGYIYIKSFGDNTAKDFEKALAAIKQKGATKFVLDLRDNTGGLFEQGIDVADQLLPEGMITMTKDKNGKEKKYNSDSKHTDMKYVILVNENTASAAEVVAAALKDNGVPVIGKKTFGKGIVQETIMFNDDTAASITVMQYFSPKGNVIHQKGIEPDYAVDMGDLSKGLENEPQLKKAVEVLNK